MDQDIINLFINFDCFRQTDAEYRKFRLFFEELKAFDDSIAEEYIERCGSDRGKPSVWEIEGVDSILLAMFCDSDDFGYNGLGPRHIKILFDIFGEEYVWRELSLWNSPNFIGSIANRIVENKTRHEDYDELREVYNSWLEFLRNR